MKNFRPKLTTGSDQYCEAWAYYSPTRAEVYVRPLDEAGDTLLPTPIKVLVPLKPPPVKRRATKGEVR